MKRHWVAWEYKNPNYELVPSIIAEINDMLDKHKIKIDYSWGKSSWDYKINLKLKTIKDMKNLE